MSRSPITSPSNLVLQHALRLRRQFATLRSMLLMWLAVLTSLRPSHLKLSYLHFTVKMHTTESSLQQRLPQTDSRAVCARRRHCDARLALMRPSKRTYVTDPCVRVIVSKVFVRISLVCFSSSRLCRHAIRFRSFGPLNYIPLLPHRSAEW